MNNYSEIPTLMDIRCNENFLHHTRKIWLDEQPSMAKAAELADEVAQSPDLRYIVYFCNITAPMLVYYVIGLGIVVAGYHASAAEAKNMVNANEKVCYDDNNEEWQALFDADMQGYLYNEIYSPDYYLYDPVEHKFLFRMVEGIQWSSGYDQDDFPVLGNDSYVYYDDMLTMDDSDEPGGKMDEEVQDPNEYPF